MVRRRLLSAAMPLAVVLLLLGGAAAGRGVDVGNGKLTSYEYDGESTSYYPALAKSISLGDSDSCP